VGFCFFRFGCLAVFGCLWEGTCSQSGQSICSIHSCQSVRRAADAPELSIRLQRCKRTRVSICPQRCERSGVSNLFATSQRCGHSAIVNSSAALWILWIFQSLCSAVDAPDILRQPELFSSFFHMTWPVLFTAIFSFDATFCLLCSYAGSLCLT
jgi:hypothetical protein